MKYDCCHLPNGIQVSVTPVFGGFKFQTKSPEKYDSFPPDWTVCLSTRQPGKDDNDSCSFTTPSLDNDTMYLSSMSMPSCEDLKPSSAPTRLVAMVLWVIFFWYYQEPEPISAESPEDKDKGTTPRRWLLNIQGHGLLGRKDQMVKLERLGMLSTKDTSVGPKVGFGGEPEMFITQKAFWQLDARIYLYSLSPVLREPGQIYPQPSGSMDSLGVGFPFGAGPETSGTFLPPYYPPQSLQYIHTGDIRHPIRPKAYRQGEVFYVRWIPSDAEYLMFRVPILPNKYTPQSGQLPGRSSDAAQGPDLCLDSELSNDLKVVYDWIQNRPEDTALPRRKSIVEQSNFLEDRMSSQNSFPVLVCWDSKPTGYFEIFWVQEDALGRSLDGTDDFDRGVRCFIGDEEFLGPKQLKRCMSSLAHHCWLYDQRTNRVMFECRADNSGVVSALESIGFFKLKEIELPDEHNTIMSIERGSWAPVL
ncbi:GNAT family N-acetyltransferase [Aspergillus stella-maris]|uniref:GNAT family N-acetyltransferase n=1 Tax=Aspergillus stella-maris TaxID=1810926 RepID=UPI003CCE0E92